MLSFFFLTIAIKIVTYLTTSYRNKGNSKFTLIEHVLQAVKVVNSETSVVDEFKKLLVVASAKELDHPITLLPLAGQLVPAGESRHE